MDFEQYPDRLGGNRTFIAGGLMEALIKSEAPVVAALSADPGANQWQGGKNFWDFF